jgi:hypothetical protein
VRAKGTFAVSTDSQIAANRANASHSTGPRTPEGKARSARNAERHGLTGRNLIVCPGDRHRFQALRADLRQELDPVLEPLVPALASVAKLRRRTHSRAEPPAVPLALPAAAPPPIVNSRPPAA